MSRPDPRSTFDKAVTRPISIQDAQRLIRFEQWVAAELYRTLIWPDDAKRRERLLGQAKAFILEAVAEMGRRGFLFDGKPLATMIRKTLAEIRAHQDRGLIHDLYPYLRQTWSTYVGTRAEELRDQCMSAGCHISALVAKLQPRELSISELAQQQSAEQLTLKAAKAAAKKATANDDTMPLFDR